MQFYKNIAVVALAFSMNTYSIAAPSSTQKNKHSDTKVDGQPESAAKTEAWLKAIEAKEIGAPSVDTYTAKGELLSLSLQQAKLLDKALREYDKLKDLIKQTAGSEQTKLKALAVERREILVETASKCLSDAAECNSEAEPKCGQFLAQTAFRAYYKVNKSDQRLGLAYKLWYRNWAAMDAQTKAKAAQYQE